MYAVLAIYHVVAGVERVDVRSFAFALRFSYALVTQLPQPASCCKMSSTYKQLSAITALLDLCSASNNLHAFSQLLQWLLEVMKSRKLPRYCPVCLTSYTGRSVHVCRHNIRLNWIREMASLGHHQWWQCLQSSRCRALISLFHLQLDMHPSRHMGNHMGTHHLLRLDILPLTPKLVLTHHLVILLVTSREHCVDWKMGFRLRFQRRVIIYSVENSSHFLYLQILFNELVYRAFQE